MYTLGLQIELLALKVLYFQGASLLVSPPCPDLCGMKDQGEGHFNRESLSTHHGDLPLTDTRASWAGVILCYFLSTSVAPAKPIPTRRVRRGQKTRNGFSGLEE